MSSFPFIIGCNIPIAPYLYRTLRVQNFTPKVSVYQSINSDLGNVGAALGACAVVDFFPQSLSNTEFYLGERKKMFDVKITCLLNATKEDTFMSVNSLGEKENVKKQKIMVIIIITYGEKK